MSAIDFDVHPEPDAVATKKIVSVGIASILVGALGVFFAAVILGVVTGALRQSFAGPSGPGRVEREISGIEQTPIWQTRVGEDLQEQQRRELEGWSWVDRKAGVANIPIERAMDLVVEESR